MIEGRATIENIKETIKKLEKMGALFDSEYSFKDIIFVPKKGIYDLNKDFLRARVYIKNDWPTKNVVLVRKQTLFNDIGKIDNLILKKEFDTEKECFDFIKLEFNDEFEKSFEYERIGWQYNFENHRGFIEDIKGYNPSIEIEVATNSKDELESLFKRIGIIEKVHNSMPEVMRKIFKK